MLRKEARSQRAEASAGVTPVNLRRAERLADRIVLWVCLVMWVVTVGTIVLCVMAFLVGIAVMLNHLMGGLLR